MSWSSTTAASRSVCTQLTDHARRKRRDQICITEAIWDEVREGQVVASLLREFGKLARQLRPLKGVSESVVLYRVRGF